MSSRYLATVRRVTSMPDPQSQRNLIVGQWLRGIFFVDHPLHHALQRLQRNPPPKALAPPPRRSAAARKRLWVWMYLLDTARLTVDGGLPPLRRLP